MNIWTFHNRSLMFSKLIYFYTCAVDEIVTEHFMLRYSCFIAYIAAGHRMWALQRLRKLLTTEYGQSININRLLGDSEGEARSIVSTV